MSWGASGGTRRRSPSWLRAWLPRVTLPARLTMSGARSKSCGRVTPRPGTQPADLGLPPPLAPITGSSGLSWAPGAPLSPPPATLDTTADEPQPASETGSGLEASSAPPCLQPGPSTPATEWSSEEGELVLDVPSCSSSQVFASWASPEPGSAPSAAPSLVPNSPPRPPEHQLSGTPPAPVRVHSRGRHCHTTITYDPEVAAALRRQVDLMERRFQFEEREAAWHRFMATFNRVADTFEELVAHLPPPDVLRPALPAIPPAVVPPAAPPTSSSEQEPPGAVDPPRPYLPMLLAPSQPRREPRLRGGPASWTRRGSRPSTHAPE
ncbi:uncharacterized protein LOC142017864 [Carettochelys insculpta]|uniref:uncharacterized protein LOC142017864 n=1 Tax=Carettochelys insculpta TaxID=44489 RepID=UPI003EB99371